MAHQKAIWGPRGGVPAVGTLISRRWVVAAAVALVALAATAPLFFDIYRTMAFNTEPRDDYGPYLQAMLGVGGRIPPAPMADRPLSVAAAIPFYHLLPVYQFSKLPALDPTYLRATEALAAVSYLCILATAGVMFLIARRRLGASVHASVIVALLSLLCAGFTGEVGVDPLCILVISLLVYVIDRPVIFAALMLASIPINEKVAILFTVLFVFRVLIGRDRTELPQLVASIVAVGGYVAMRAALGVPGYEQQLSPATYLPTAVGSIPYLLSLKGAVTNTLPVLLVACLALVSGWTAVRMKIDTPVWRPSDALVWLAILGIAMAVDLQYTIGRIVMFTYPLYLPMLAVALDAMFPEREPTGPA